MALLYAWRSCVGFSIPIFRVETDRVLLPFLYQFCHVLTLTLNGAFYILFFKISLLVVKVYITLVLLMSHYLFPFLQFLVVPSYLAILKVSFINVKFPMVCFSAF